MFHKLHILYSKGYVPDVVLDIGAHKGTWASTMREHIFKGSEYHLFEPNEHRELANVCNVHNVLLSDGPGEVDWYCKGTTGDSMFKEITYHFDDCKIEKRSTIDLDTYIKNTGILGDAHNIFMKIDCQGAEIPILKGSRGVLEKTDFIVMELPMFGRYNEGVPGFSEHINFVESIGFVPYDVVDSHYMNGFNMQVDMLFINKKHPWNTEVNEKIRHTLNVDGL